MTQGTRTDARMEAWRQEFPCRVIHQGYPDGTTCLQCRDFAVNNVKPHKFAPEFRQRYLEWERNLFCDNCWSCHVMAAYALSRERAVWEEAAKECQQRWVERGPFGEFVYCADLAYVLRARAAELKEEPSHDR